MDVRVGLGRKLSAKELMLLNCGVGEVILVFLNDLQWLESAFWDSGKVMEVGVYSLHTRKGDRKRPLKPLNSWSQEKLEEARGFSPRAPLSLRTSVVQNCERNLGE